MGFKKECMAPSTFLISCFKQPSEVFANQYTGAKLSYEIVFRQSFTF